VSSIPAADREIMLIIKISPLVKQTFAQNEFITISPFRETVFFASTIPPSQKYCGIISAEGNVHYQ
jgi:hypothetical protein